MDSGIAWKIESLRFTGFPTGFNPASSKGWWQQVGGSDQFTLQENRAAGQIHEEGKVGEQVLSLVSTPLRIDMLMRPDPNQVSPFEAPSIGRVGEQLPAFESKIGVLLSLDGFPKLSRLAVGAVLVHEVGSVEEGYSIVARLIPVKFNTEGVSDFLLQANRRREIGVGSSRITINQLLKWATMVTTLTAVDGQSPTQPKVMGTLIAVRIEEDLSTLAEEVGSVPSLNPVEVVRSLLARIGPLADDGFAEKR